jgi:2-methylcitrate dehydratase
VLIRYLDFNDTYLSLEPAHPSDNIVAALAAAELAGSTGRDLLGAVVLGYEVQCRLCDAASLRARGWDHVTYGAISTALLSGKLLGLSAEQLRHALALAAIPNVALRQTRSGELSMWKGCAFANAARNGVFAALLAGEGVTGPWEVFEGEFGFWKQVAGPFALPPLAGVTGDDWMILQTYIKFWPVEYHAQSAVDAALQLRSKIDITQIERIEIASFDAAVDIIGKDPEKYRPRSRETADHSMPYCVAIALLAGDVTAAHFGPHWLAHPRVANLLQRTTMQRDPVLNAGYPEGIPNRLRITQADGKVAELEVRYPRGHARNPMTDDEVEQKFLSATTGSALDGRQRAVLDLLWQIDTAASVAPLFALLAVDDLEASADAGR